MSEGTVQLPPDSTGIRVDLVPVTIPAGTTIVDASGTQTTLTSDLTYFRQATVIGDPDAAGLIASVRGERGRGALLTDSPEVALLASINDSLRTIKTLLELAVG